ncbi:MFS transporter [Candidatus Thorarchaeota archaeon]|nr:MAG: MFS transporter [Candidatus Thorarchaeota archaeon]
MEEKSLVFTRSGAAIIPMQLTSGFINSLYFTFIPLYVYDLYGFIASSLCRTLVAVTAILLSWVWGWVSDVFSSKKKLLVISILGQAIFTVLFALTQIVGEPGLMNLIFILFMYTLAALFTSMYNPVRNSVITLMSKEEGRASNIGSFFLFSSAGWGIGALIIGYLWEIIPLYWIFIFTGGIHLLSMVIFQAVFQESDVTTEESTRRGIIEGLRNMKPLLLYITLAILLVSVGRGIFLPIFQIKMYIIFGRESLWIGIISALSGLAGAIGSFAYGKLTDRIGDSFALKLGIFGNVALFLLGILNHPLTAALVWIFPVWPLIAVSSVSLAAGHSEETRRGEAQGVVESARSFSGFFSVIGGIVATFVGAEENVDNLNPFFFSLITLPLLALIPVSRSKLGEEERRKREED